MQEVTAENINEFSNDMFDTLTDRVFFIHIENKSDDVPTIDHLSQRLLKGLKRPTVGRSGSMLFVAFQSDSHFVWSLSAGSADIQCKYKRDGNIIAIEDSWNDGGWTLTIKVG